MPFMFLLKLNDGVKQILFLKMKSLLLKKQVILTVASGSFLENDTPAEEELLVIIGVSEQLCCEGHSAAGRAEGLPDSIHRYKRQGRKLKETLQNWRKL